MRTEEARESTSDTTGRPRRGRGIALTALAVVALALVGLAAGRLAEYQWGRFVEYESPYRFDLPPAPETPRLTERVVLVIVDGLREDVARDLPAVRELGAEGSFLVAHAAEPSLSYPGWTLLATGAPPEISGVTTNWYEGPVEVESLFDSADRAGLTVAVAGDEGWGELFDGLEHTALVPDEPDSSDPRVGRRSLRMLEEVQPDLLVVHLSDVDKRGHEEGVGEAYMQAARGADDIIAELHDAVGPGTALVVASDHGHIDSGGHGGHEPEVVRTPLVLAGQGLVPGARGGVPQADVAPTIAALLGLGRPGHAVGEIRVELLDAPDDVLEEIAVAHDEASSRFHARATRALGSGGDTAADLQRARDERLRDDILGRLPIALAAVALAAIALALSSHRLDGVGVAMGMVVVLGVLAALFFGRGLTLSFSAFNTEEQIVPFLLRRMVDAVVAGLAGGLIAGVVAARRRRAGSFQTGMGTAAWSMFVLAIGAATFLVLFGWGFEWRLPNLAASFAHLMALVWILALGVTASLVGLVALGAGWVARSRRV